MGIEGGFGETAAPSVPIPFGIKVGLGIKGSDKES